MVDRERPHGISRHPAAPFPLPGNTSEIHLVVIMRRAATAGIMVPSSANHSVGQSAFMLLLASLLVVKPCLRGGVGVTTPRVVGGALLQRRADRLLPLLGQVGLQARALGGAARGARLVEPCLLGESMHIRTRPSSSSESSVWQVTGGEKYKKRLEEYNNDLLIRAEKLEEKSFKMILGRIDSACARMVSSS
jgi:hypothetical protein